MERWQSVTEIAKHLGVSKETIYRWLEIRTIPGHKIGRLWKFKVSEVDQWVIAGGASETEIGITPLTFNNNNSFNLES